jgi:hypothetical protein
MVSRYHLISYYVRLIPTAFSAPSLSWVPFFDPGDIKILGLGAIWNFSKGVDIRLWGTKGPIIRPRCIGTVRARTQYKSINQSINQSILRYHIIRDRQHYKIHCDVCQLFFLLLINPFLHALLPTFSHCDTSFNNYNLQIFFHVCSVAFCSICFSLLQVKSPMIGLVFWLDILPYLGSSVNVFQI